MKRHPSEYFVKYLLTLKSPDAQKDDWIRMAVQTLGFPAPDAVYISNLREALYVDLPVNYDPIDRYNRPSVRFLRNAGVWSLHNPDDKVKAASSILPNFRVRRLVEQLLLGRLDPKDVAKKVNGRMNAYFTEGMIQTYAHYYWNCPLLKTQDWVDFFEEYDKSIQSKSIAVLQNGPAMALHVNGFGQNLETKEILREMQEALYFDFRDWKEQPRSRDKTTALTKLAKAATSVDVRLSEADSALRESLKAFEQFRMKHSQGVVKSIEEVAPHGEFTDSGMDLKELPAPKKEAG